VGVDQRREGPEVLLGHAAAPRGVREDILDHQRVDMGVTSSVPRRDPGYEVNTWAESGSLRLTYAVGRGGQERASLDYVVPLVTTVLASGGRRWWFLCPACRGGGPACGRRVGMLYLPPGGRVFACRGCHDLAYTSSRESRKWDGLMGRLAAGTGCPPGAVKAWLKRRRGPFSG
jgi:hypothetical protein